MTALEQLIKEKTKIHFLGVDIPTPKSNVEYDGTCFHKRFEIPAGFPLEIDSLKQIFVTEFAKLCGDSDSFSGVMESMANVVPDNPVVNWFYSPVRSVCRLGDTFGALDSILEKILSNIEKVLEYINEKISPALFKVCLTPEAQMPLRKWLKIYVIETRLSLKNAFEIYRGITDNPVSNFTKMLAPKKKVMGRLFSLGKLAANCTSDITKYLDDDRKKSNCMDGYYLAVALLEDIDLFEINEIPPPVVLEKENDNILSLDSTVDFLKKHKVAIAGGSLIALGLGILAVSIANNNKHSHNDNGEG